MTASEFAHSRGIPDGVFAAERLGVALDQRHGRLELVADHRDERALQLLGLADLGHVVHVGDDVHQPSLAIEDRGVANADRHDAAVVPQ